jgi:hypothetical protein
MKPAILLFFRYFFIAEIVPLKESRTEVEEL